MKSDWLWNVKDAGRAPLFVSKKVRVNVSSITAVPKSTSLTSTLGYNHSHRKPRQAFTLTHLFRNIRKRKLTKIRQNDMLLNLTCGLKISRKLQEISSWGTEGARWMAQSVLRNQLFLQYLHRSGNTHQWAKCNKNPDNVTAKLNELRFYISLNTK